ncbi:unnamed protein product, partial [Closterium sp. NIES-53]
HKRQAYTAAEKLKWVAQLDLAVSVRALARESGIHRKCLANWKRAADFLKEAHSARCRMHGRGRASWYRPMEIKVYERLLDWRRKETAVSVGRLQEWSREFMKILYPLVKWKGSQRWSDRAHQERRVPEGARDRDVGVHGGRDEAEAMGFFQAEDRAERSVPAGGVAAVKPAAPVARETVAPVAREPVAPVAREPVAPVARESVARLPLLLAAEPVTPVARVPVAPVASVPVAPVARVPVAPVAPCASSFSCRPLSPLLS